MSEGRKPVRDLMGSWLERIDAIGNRFTCVGLFALAVVFTAVIAANATPIIMGDPANFVVLYEGLGGNTLNTNNTNISGNIGIGNTGQFAASGGCTPSPCVINGNIEFAGTVHESSSGTLITGTVTGGNANVATDLTNLNALSSTLGGETGTPLTINLNNLQTQTVSESSGNLVNGDRIFSVSSFNFTNGAILTIAGDGTGDPVVFSFTSSPSFGGAINLTGLTSDQVLFNVTASNGLTINTNGATESGDFLDPNGAIQANHSVVNGRIFGGDSSNMQLVSGLTLNAPPPSTVPEPSSMVLFATGLVGLFGGVLRRKRRIT